MSQGNPNVVRYNACQYLTVDGTSDSVTLNAKCRAITVYSTAACWLLTGNGTVTAVKPGAEKTTGATIFIPGATFVSGIEVGGNDTTPPVVAAIQDSAGGSLYVYEHWTF